MMMTFITRIAINDHELSINIYDSIRSTRISLSVHNKS